MKDKIFFLNILTLLIFCAFPVHAQEPVDANPDSLFSSQVSELAPIHDNQNTVLSFGGNPYDCIGQTDTPHKSTHQPGTINVTASTRCSLPVSTIYVDTVLQKWTCIGICFWANVGSFSPRTGIGTYVKTNSAAACNSGAYRGLSNHRVTDTFGQIYIALTSNQITISCP